MKSVVACCKVSVLCIQETKVCLISQSFLRSFVGSRFNKCHFISSVGASGGIAMCWNARDFTCLEVIVRNYSLTLRLKHYSSGLVFYITNVYRPPTWDGKEEFCSELAALKGVRSGRWVLYGDFNLTRNQLERRGREGSRKLMSLFSNLINELELLDLPLANQ